MILHTESGGGLQDYEEVVHMDDVYGNVDPLHGDIYIEDSDEAQSGQLPGLAAVSSTGSAGSASAGKRKTGTAAVVSCHRLYSRISIRRQLTGTASSPSLPLSLALFAGKHETFAGGNLIAGPPAAAAAPQSLL